jgi:hypothetical protein
VATRAAGRVSETAARHKYGARRTEYSGAFYASKAEAHRAMELDAMLRAGEIRSWCRPRPTILVPGKREDRVSFQPDFHVVDCYGSEWWEDVKGVQTAVFKVKARLWRYLYPDRELRVIEA